MATRAGAIQAFIRMLNPDVTRLAAAAVGIVLLAWSGIGASRAGAARRAELRQAEGVLATFASWRQQYKPAVAAESISWKRTLLQLQALGASGEQRLSLTRAVVRAAEAAGLRDVRVLIHSPDTTGSAERLSTEGVSRKAASFGLSVDCRGNLQAIVNFLGELPPSVAPTQLILVRQDGRARHRVTLAVYELEFSNGPANFATPVERSDSRPVGDSRDGG